MEVTYRRANGRDARALFALEEASYPSDEAATLAGIVKRIDEAGDFFLVAEVDGEIAGFVNGTLTTSSELTHDTMSTHEPTGSLLCVHSVVVAPELRRKGLALSMLGRYLDGLKGSGPGARVREIRLLCKEVLRPLYEKAGFELVGPSKVVHGKDQWLEMKMMCSNQT